VPSLPPNVNGVGDYGWAIAKAMERECSVTTHFIVLNKAGLGESPTLSQFDTARSADELVNALLKSLQGENCPILLQYCGYAYQTRGAPVGLIWALDRVRRERSNTRLAVMFHELYAFGPPWTSSFWLSPIQRWLAKRLATTADAVLTNCFVTRGHLQRWTKRDIPVLPVPSNIGEPLEHALTPPSMRAGVAIVFGQTLNRKRSHQALSSAQSTLRRFGVEEIWDVGPRPEEIHSTSELPVKFFGYRSPAEVSALIAKCRMGVLAYPRHCLTRSGVFAALAAHGTPTLVCPTEASNALGLAEGIHFYDCAGVELPNSNSLDAVSANVRAWYIQHSLAAQARSQLSLLYS
jgi:hypothetical protein